MQEAKAGLEIALTRVEELAVVSRGRFRARQAGTSTENLRFSRWVRVTTQPLVSSAIITVNATAKFVPAFE